MATITLAGTLYSDNGVTPLTAGCTLAVSVNGAAAALITVTSLADGTYLTAGFTANAGDVLTVYVQDGVNTQKAVTVTRCTGSNMTGVGLYQNSLNLRSDDGTSLSAANINTAKANGATGISAIYSATSTTLTTASGKQLCIMSGQSYTQGSTTTVAGDWLNLGTFVSGGTTNSVVLTGTGSQKLTSGGSAFTKLTIQAGAGTYTLQDALTCGCSAGSVALTLTSGTLDVSSSNYSVTLTKGNFTYIAGTFNARAGTVTATSSSSQTWTNLSAVSFYNVTIANSGGSLVSLATSGLVVTNTLTISAGGGLATVNLGLTLTGATFVNAGTLQVKGGETMTGFTNDTANGGTVKYVGTSATNYTGLVAGNSYANLTLTLSNGFLKPTGSVTVSGALTVNSNVGGAWNANGQTVTVTGLTTISSSGLYQADTATQTFNGGLTISSGTFTGSSGAVDVNGTFAISGGTFTAPSGAFTVSGNWAVSGTPTFTPGTNTVALDGAGGQTISGNTTFYNLTATGGDRTLTFTDGTTQTVSNALTLTGTNGHLLTLAGTGAGGWTIAVPATQSISYVSVSYSMATGNAAGAPNSTDGGHNTNWTFTPANIALPAVTGTPQVGQTLTTDTGTWTGSPTSYAYQWQRADDSGFATNVTSIGTNAATYTLTSSESGKYARCQVTATNAGGSATASSNGVGPVVSMASSQIQRMLTGIG